MNSAVSGRSAADPPGRDQPLRRAGYQHLHVAIDDHTRLAYCELLRSERKADCAAILGRAISWYASQGIVVERVLADNAKAYHSPTRRDTCLELGIERRYTRSYSLWTKRKAEALIKTLLREWAYASPTPNPPTAPGLFPATSGGTTDQDHAAHWEPEPRSAAALMSVVSTAASRPAARLGLGGPGPRGIFGLASILLPGRHLVLLRRRRTGSGGTAQGA